MAHERDDQHASRASGRERNRDHDHDTDRRDTPRSGSASGASRSRDTDDDYTRALRDRYGHGQGGYDRSAYPQGGHGGSPEDRGVQTAGSRADAAMNVARNRPFGDPRSGLADGITGLYEGGDDQPRRTSVAHPGQDAPRRGGFRGHGPKGYRRTDARIIEDVCERLTDDDDVDASAISVEVSDGVATLTGTVPDRRMKHRAEDLAESCAGVSDVENRLRVVRPGGGSSGSDDRGR